MPSPVLPDSFGHARAFFLLPLTSVATIPDGGEHLYLLRLASLPGWAWSGPITGLRLDLISATTDEIAIRSLDLIQVDELGTSGN